MEGWLVRLNFIALANPDDGKDDDDDDDDGRYMPLPSRGPQQRK